MYKKATRHRVGRLRKQALTSDEERQLIEIKREHDRLKIGPFHEHPILVSRLAELKKRMAELSEYIRLMKAQASKSRHRKK